MCSIAARWRGTCEPTVLTSADITQEAVRLRSPGRFAIQRARYRCRVRIGGSSYSPPSLMAAFHPLPRCVIGASVHAGSSGDGIVKLYRINKLSRPGGSVVKKKDVLASSDSEAVQRAADSDDCPVCDVLKDGQTVGSII